MRDMTSNHSSGFQPSDFDLPFQGGSPSSGTLREGAPQASSFKISTRPGLTHDQQAGIQRGTDLVFVALDAVDADEKLQAIFSMNPTGTIRVQELSGTNPLQAVTKHLRSFSEGAVNRIWFLLGQDQRFLQQLADRRNDHSVQSWQQSVADDARICFVDPINSGLAAHLRKVSQIEVVEVGHWSQSVALNEVIFVDERVAGYQSLVTELLKKHEAEVVLLPENQSGIQQIQQFLQGRKGLQAIHLIGPNKPGTLLLGSSVVNQQSIEKDYSGFFRELQRCFANEGEIRIYGGRFNQGADGLAAVKALSASAGVFVVVSRVAADTATDPLPSQFPQKIGKPEGVEWPAGFQTLMEPGNPKVILPESKLLDAWDVEMAEGEEQFGEDPFGAEQLYHASAQSRTMLPPGMHPKASAVQRAGTAGDLGWPLGWVLVGLAAGSLVTILAQQFGLL